MNMNGWAYIALTALLAWAWGNYQYGKGWKDCQWCLSFTIVVGQKGERNEIN